MTYESTLFKYLVGLALVKEWSRCSINVCALSKSRNLNQSNINFKLYSLSLLCQLIP